MATEYQYIDYALTPVYSSTSGIASSPAIITKDSSMDMANPSTAKNLYMTKADSPYYNPNVMGSYPISTKTIPYTPTKPKSAKKLVIVRKEVCSKSKDNMLLIALLVFVLFVLFMTN